MSDITSILIHPKDINKIWITYGSYHDFGYRLKVVLNSVDGGMSWTNYSDGLPYMPVNSIVMNSNRTEDEELYLGTDVGIFYRNKYMFEWKCYGSALPSVPVTDLKINPNRKFIRAALYGRGVWQSDLFCPPAISSYNLSGTNGSPERFYHATQYITSNSTIAATEVFSNTTFSRKVAYRAPSISFTAGFKVELGATFLAGAPYSCVPYTANIANKETFLMQNSSTKPTNSGRKREADMVITPNPFSNTVTFSFNLDQKSVGNLIVYDITGKVINQVVNQSMLIEGNHEYDINTSSWSQGIYFCKFTLQGKTKVYKFVKQE